MRQWFCFIVGVAGFEPATPCSQSRCANRTALYPVRPHLSGDFRAANVTIFHKQMCKLIVIQRNDMKNIYVAALFIILGLGSLSAQTQELNLEATMDNSMYEEGELSNGAGDYIFAGVTKNNAKRRALVNFDLSSALPHGITIDSAILILRPSKVKTSGTSANIHKVKTGWGEGTSDANAQEGKGVTATQNDATWTHAKTGGESWSTPGGDYEPVSSASTEVKLGSNSVFASTGVTADVNGWLANPDGNFGWIVIGDESTSSTSLRFYSKENSEIDFRPTLKLYYQGATFVNPFSLNSHNISVSQGSGTGHLIIRNKSDLGICRMDVYSITGSHFYSNELLINSGETRMESGIDKPGIYIYRIVSPLSQSSGKFVVQ